MTTWYELEILPQDPSLAFYPIALMNRSDENAGFDLFTSQSLQVETTPQFVPFGISARLLKVEPMPHGTSNEYIKTDSHFFLMPRSSIYKSGLMMANSTGVIDKSYRGELKAPVWSMTGNSTVQRVIVCFRFWHRIWAGSVMFVWWIHFRIRNVVQAGLDRQVSETTRK